MQQGLPCSRHSHHTLAASTSKCGKILYMQASN